MGRHAMHWRSPELWQQRPDHRKDSTCRSRVVHGNLKALLLKSITSEKILRKEQNTYCGGRRGSLDFFFTIKRFDTAPGCASFRLLEFRIDIFAKRRPNVSS
jgi:hypothetical protein